MTDHPNPGPFDQLVAKNDKGLEHMWRNKLADAVLELFERDGTVTKESLKEDVVSRIADDGISRLDKAIYRGALKALDGNPPS